MEAVRKRNARLVPVETTLGRQARQQAAVSRLGQFALTRSDLREVMDAAVGTVAETLGIELCKVLELLPDGELLLRAGVGWSEEYVGRARVDTGPDSQAGYTLRHEEPVVVEDLRTETRFRGTAFLVEHAVVSGISCVIRGEDGEPFGVLGAHSRRCLSFGDDDVHFLQSIANVLGGAIQRDRAQRALRESEERYRNLLNSVRDPIFIYPLEPGDRPGRFIEANEAAVRSLGYTREELRSRTVLDITNVDETRFRANIARVRSGARVIEAKYRARDGRLIPVEVSVRIRELAGRELVITVVREIADRKRAEQELESRNRRLRLLAESSSALLSSEDPGPTFAQVFASFDPGLGIDAYFHHTLDPDGGGLRLEAAAGLPHEADDILRLVRPARAAYRRLVDPDPVIIEDVQGSADPLAVWLRELGVTALVSYVLRGDDAVVGTLVFVSRTRTRFDPDSIDLMRAVCDQFATAVGRTRARRAEQETAARLRAIVETAADGIITVEEHGIIESVNPAAERIFGYHRSELVGRRDVMLLSERSRDSELPALSSLIRSGDTGAGGLRDEVEGRRKDGSPVPLEIAVSETRLNGSRILTAIVRDISDRKRAEQSLRESERRFRSVADASPVVIAVADPQGHATYLNRTWREYTGTSDERATAMDWLNAVHPEDRTASLERMRSAIRERAPLRMELRLRRHDGAYHWFLCHAVPRFGAEREYLGHIGTAVDITSQKEAEEQLLRLNVRLQRLNDTLEERIARRTERLERQSARLRRLAAELTRAEQRERDRLAVLIHDHLQQLLVAARMRVELADERTEDPRLKSLLVNAAEMVDQSLNATRSLTAELRPPVLQDLGLGAALEWLAARMREQHGLKVSLDLEPSAEPHDETIRAILFEGARELLFNVVKHAETDGAAMSTVATPAGAVRLVIEDRGTGFDPADLEGERRTVNRFGLFSIQERLRAMGGDFRLRTAPGSGTRVELRAPLSLIDTGGQGDDTASPSA